jgi:hypothetical protein
MSRLQGAVVALIAVVLGAAGIAYVLECEGRLVSMGASLWEVQAIYGAPTQSNDTVELVQKPVYDPQGHIAGHLPVGVHKQVWIYNVGSSRLIYMLTFLDGGLVKIDTGGYGY